jgi:FecR protein
MDEQDKEFETFLRQFHLRQHAAFPAEAPVEATSRWHGRRWVFAAASAAIVAVLAIPLVRDRFNPVSPAAVVEVTGDSKYKAGDSLAAGTVIHSGGFEPLLVRLEDGTRVEMRAQSQIVVESAEDGTRIRLNNGSILVRVASQLDGHLYVRTNDTVVSVVGTLFLVESLPQGSRVAVLEGKLEVRMGTATQQLMAGQQVSSNSEIEFASVEELIAWSREAGSLKTLIAGGIGGPTATQEKAESKETAPRPVPAVPNSASVQGQAPQQEPPPPPEEQPRPAPSREGQPQSDAGADSPGRQTFYRACVACHNDEIAKGRQWPSRESIENFVRFEISRGASVPPSEVQPLVDYIYTNARAKRQ